MEFIVITLGYFALLSCMVYKGADVPTILASVAVFVSSYLGFAKENNSRNRKRNDK